MTTTVPTAGAACPVSRSPQPPAWPTVTGRDSTPAEAEKGHLVLAIGRVSRLRDLVRDRDDRAHAQDAGGRDDGLGPMHTWHT